MQTMRVFINTSFQKKRCQRQFHLSSRNEIAPVVIGLGLFVASQVAVYALKSLDEENHDDMGIHNRALHAARTGRSTSQRNSSLVSHPLYLETSDSIGIDLGTMNMKIANLAPIPIKNKQVLHLPEVIENRTGQRSTVTMVQMNGVKPIVGGVAKERRFSDPNDIVFDLQSLILDAYQDEQSPLTIAPFQASQLKNDQRKFNIEEVMLQSNSGESIPASSVYSALVRELLSTACTRLGGDDIGRARLNNAVLILALPSCLPQPVRGALLISFMREVAQAAAVGYKANSDGENDVFDSSKAVVLGSIEDCMAVLLALLERGCLDDGVVGKGRYLLMVDIGARLTQTSLIRGNEAADFVDPSNGKEWVMPEPLDSQFQYCGMEAAVQQLASQLTDEFNLKTQKVSVGVDLGSDHLARQRVHTAAEEANHTLSSTHCANINLPFIAMDFATMKPLHLETSLSRSQLGQTCANIFEDILEPIKASVAALHAKHGEVTEESPIHLKLVLSGGGARSHALVDRIKSEIKATLPHSANTFRLVDVSAPEELVVVGAALAPKFGWVS